MTNHREAEISGIAFTSLNIPISLIYMILNIHYYENDQYDGEDCYEDQYDIRIEMIIKLMIVIRNGSKLSSSV